MSNSVLGLVTFDQVQLHKGKVESFKSHSVKVCLFILVITVLFLPQTDAEASLCAVYIWFQTENGYSIIPGLDFDVFIFYCNYIINSIIK